MQGAHKRLFEITELLQDDAQGNFLMEEVLNACFDYAMPTLDAKLEPTEAGADCLSSLVDALDRFNVYLAGRFSLCNGGLFRGAANEVALWSQDLTCQILSNRPN